MSEDDEILIELRNIKRLLEFLAKDSLEISLNRVATTQERREIWALCDGLTSTAAIAHKVGITPRTVRRYVLELSEANLAMIEKRGYPKRRFDIIPYDWEVR